MTKFGVSFSAKYARELGVDPRACLKAGLELGFKRLRLMSYWDIHEPWQEKYDFKELDWQFELAAKYGAEVTLAIGLRQPRWPESHWPEWAVILPPKEWQKALNEYLEAVVRRFRNHSSLVSWQLENEALLTTFGLNGNFDRNRLKQEYKLIKTLDAKHPVIMSCSDSWGIPVFGPKPDIYGFSMYRYFYDRGRYRHSSRPAAFYRLRAYLINILKGRPVFIHELQAEPWGPVATVNMDMTEQARSMTFDRVVAAINYAENTGLEPIDFWGLEWWYWLKISHESPEVWQYIKDKIAKS